MPRWMACGCSSPQTDCSSGRSSMRSVASGAPLCHQASEVEQLVQRLQHLLDLAHRVVGQVGDVGVQHRQA